MTVSVNDNFTVTVDLTNAQNLFAWQIILKYNGTDLRLNSLWVPEDSVFAGHMVEVLPSFTNYRTDAIDGSRSGLLSANLFCNDSVNVSNGVICRANFAVLSAGQSLIEVAFKSNPLHQERGPLSYSFWLASNDVLTGGEEDAVGSNCTVLGVNGTVTGPLVGTIYPLDSTSFLGLENFTVSSVSNISSLSFNRQFLS